MGRLSSEEKLPMVPEEVRPEWLSGVLGHKVKQIEIRRKVLEATTGKLFVTITYEDQAKALAANMPKHICLKGGFNAPFIAAMAPVLVPLYRREAEFFIHLARRIPHIDPPRSWWAGSNSRQGIIAMEDLSWSGDGRVVTFGDPTEPWPVDLVKLGVEQLAALHAATWGAKPVDYPWLVQPEQYEQTVYSLCGMWKDMALAPGRPYFPPVICDQARVTAAYRKHFATRDPRLVCLVHGDAHIGNTFVENGRPRFLDWQLIHFGTGMHDVNYFLVGALTIEDRRDHEKEILEHYLAAVARFGGPRLTLDDVMVEYRKSSMAGIGWMLTPFRLQSRARVMAISPRYAAAIVDHKTIELIESLPDPK